MIPRADRTLVMGIINVTPDSFSDGGSWPDAESAIAHGRQLLAEGADLLDVGGESTRPGAARPTQGEELARVIPVIRALAEAGAVVSVDTMRSEVARQAVEAGAKIVNDVSGGLADPKMYRVVAEAGAGYVLMHWRGHSATMQHADHLHYDDVVADVCAELGQRVAEALAAGIDPSRLVVDPGFGFSKTADHNWELLRGIDAVQRLGHPVLVGVSRKSFLGARLSSGGVARPPGELDDATAAISAWCAERGIWAVRTHTVAAHLDAARVMRELRGTGPSRPE
ncbi:dihydropteroate synthase [Enemella sp. A6]|uniref:dihydropteroate synthase n=1 Tax=Enemella sp. A6 TaxID=3440152 RepID=UPI003EBC8FBF